MTRKDWKQAFFILFAIFFVRSLNPAAAGTFFGSVPTGLMQVQEYRYPVFLFVPEKYDIQKAYPLIVSLSENGASPEKHMRGWNRLAKKKNWVVVVPTLSLREGEDPDNYDEWILRIVKDVRERYRIHPQKVFIIGKGSGAHYAAYLAARYPEEFSAAALIDGDWNGPFERLIRPQGRPVKQLPFYLALPGNQEARLQEAEKTAYRFTERGYPVYLKKLADGQDPESGEFRNEVVAWLEENAARWQTVIEESRKKFKEKARSQVEEFFEVK